MGKYQRYNEDFKKEMIRLHLEDGRTKKSLSDEYNIGAGTLTNWLKQYREECKTNPILKEEQSSYETHRKLLKEIAELKKENEFLKKAAAFFAKEID